MEVATPQEAAVTPEPAPAWTRRPPRYTFEQFCKERNYSFRSPANRACRAQEEARRAYNEHMGIENPTRSWREDEHYRIWLKRIGAKRQARA